MVQAHSFSFQKAKAMFSRPCVSDTPAMPSSPHRYVLDRAWSCEKSGNLINELHTVQSQRKRGEEKDLERTAPRISVLAAAS